MHIVYLTKDLLFSSRVCSLASQHGSTIEVLSSVDAGTTSAAELALIDLAMRELDITEAVRSLRQRFSKIKIVAYGPHVDEAMLAAAEQAGCDLVLPRSQFNQQIGSILAGE